MKLKKNSEFIKSILNMNYYSPFKFIYLILLVLFINNKLFSIFATVSEKNNKIYDEPFGQIQSFRLPPGLLINIDKTENGYARFSYQKKKYWIKTNDIDIYDNIFSNTKEQLVISKKISKDSQNNYYFSYYKNSTLYYFDILKKKIINSYKIKGISDFYPSDDNNLLLITGINTNNKIEYYNYQLYNNSKNSLVFIGTFNKEKWNVLSCEFNKDNSCIAIKLTNYNDNKSYLFIYLTESGKLISVIENIIDYYWFNNDLYIFSNDLSIKLVKFNKSISDELLILENVFYNKEFIITNGIPSNKKSKITEYKWSNNKFYYNINNSIYSFDLESYKIQKTPYKSLIFDEKNGLNFYEINDNNILLDVDKNKIINEFSEKKGVPIKYEFIDFCGDYLLGRMTVEKINTLFLTDTKGNIIYQYMAIDNPEVYNEIGIVIETVIDNNLSIIIIENPNYKDYFIIY